MDKDNIYVLRDIDCFMSVTEAIREQGLTLENRIIEKKVIVKTIKCAIGY